MNLTAQKVLEALRDERWDWRTLDGLKRSTGLSAATILEVILDNRSDIDFEVAVHRDNLLFRLKNRKKASSSLLDSALDVLSFGMRPTVA